MLDVERTSHYLLWRILGGANGFHRRGISRRQQSTKGGIWTFNFQLNANEVGGGGGANHENITEPYGVSSQFNRDTASRFFHFWLIFPKLSVTLNTM